MRCPRPKQSRSLWTDYLRPSATDGVLLLDASVTASLLRLESDPVESSDARCCAFDRIGTAQVGAAYRFGRWLGLTMPVSYA